MLAKALQFEKDANPILVTPLGIIILVKLLQFEKTLSFKTVTLSGIIIFVKLVHSLNKPFESSFNDVDNCTLVKEVQFE